MEASAEGTTKAERRRKAAAVRDAVPAEERVSRSAQLCINAEREVLQPLRRRLGRPLTVCVYAAFRSEADPLDLLRTCLASGDAVAAPRIEGGRLEWRIIREPEEWHAGQWGIPEPDPLRTELMPADRAPDAVLVPGLSFDPQGGRLGYGGGYYDRLYAAERLRGHDRICWIGFALSFQLNEEPLPREPHDLTLDVLATDEEIIWLNGRERDGGNAGKADAF